MDGYVAIYGRVTAVCTIVTWTAHALVHAEGEAFSLHGALVGDLASGLEIEGTLGELQSRPTLARRDREHLGLHLGVVVTHELVLGIAIEQMA